MKKKGISLITLVITIVVVIILAAVVILSIGSNNPIDSARVANVAGTRDSINSVITSYIAKLKVETMGEFSSSELLCGELEQTKKYKITDNVNCTIEEKGESKLLHKIDNNIASIKLGIEIKKIDNNSSWYVDDFGKVYLIYNTKELIAKYLKENNEILDSVSTYVNYARNIINGPVEIYTITFETNGGSLTNSSIQIVQGERLNPPIPTRLGYKFKGWYKDIELSEALEEEFYPTSDVVLYANWSLSEDTPYKVIHKLMDLDGETYTTYEEENLEGKSGSEITPEVKSYPGFTAPSTITTVILPEGTTEVTYKYARNQYSYTLSTGTGTVTTGSTASGTYYYGTTIVLKCSASSGYQSARWTSSDTALVSSPTALNTTFEMPAGNITMTSSASLIYYSISYSLDGGSASNPTSYSRNSYFTLSNPTKGDYEFIGWTGSNGSTPQKSVTISGSSMSGNKSYTANWDNPSIYFSGDGWVSYPRTIESGYSISIDVGAYESKRVTASASAYLPAGATIYYDYDDWAIEQSTSNVTMTFEGITILNANGETSGNSSYTTTSAGTLRINLDVASGFYYGGNNCSASASFHISKIMKGSTRYMLKDNN